MKRYSIGIDAESDSKVEEALFELLGDTKLALRMQALDVDDSFEVCEGVQVCRHE